LGFGVRYAGGVPVDAAQIVWGMLTWLVLGWAVGVRVVRHWAGRRAAFASIAGFVAVVLVYLALKLAVPGTERFLESGTDSTSLAVVGVNHRTAPLEGRE